MSPPRTPIGPTAPASGRGGSITPRYLQHLETIYGSKTLDSSAQPTEALPRAVTGLFLDTLELRAVPSQIEGALTAAALAELRRAEKAAEEGVLDEIELVGLRGAWRPTVRRARAERYPLWLSSVGGSYDVGVSLTTGRVKVRCRSAWLFEVDPAGAYRAVIEGLGRWLFGDRSAVIYVERPFVVWDICRLDLTADFAGFPIADLTPDQFARRSRAATDYGEALADASTREHFSGSTRTGISFGRRDSPISAVVYDKTYELRRNPRPYLEAEYRLHGWDGMEPITRLEIRLTSRGLRSWRGMPVDSNGEEISGTDPRVLLRWNELAPQLWAYLTGHEGQGGDEKRRGWLRLVVPGESDTNRWRWRTDPRWSAVSALGRVGTLQRAPAVRALRLEEVRRRAEAKLVSAALSLVSSAPKVRVQPGRELEAMERAARVGLMAGVEHWARRRKGDQPLVMGSRIWTEVPSLLSEAFRVRRKGYSELFPSVVAETALAVAS